ncbi:dyslexia-associated protein KIAA0319 homolog [Mugil cephalus]|uniref:dyslexia-associated protein KIAA0319 homolog n=1 Tax=Mugil cephalus TaxID=48193 RepID=UPI001FB61F5B|nr:dyslexia-associated protein KIAA0319 homolog [Mugil cephalus]
MWKKTFLLLLHSVEAVVASPCWQGASFSEAVVSPAVEGGGVLRVPGVASMRGCVAACCDLPGCDLAWLFRGSCYILSCQQREHCRPRQSPGADSFLAFLRGAPPQTLILRGPGGRWRPLPRPSQAPGLLEALEDEGRRNQEEGSEGGGARRRSNAEETTLEPRTVSDSASSSPPCSVTTATETETTAPPTPTMTSDPPTTSTVKSDPPTTSTMASDPPTTSTVRFDPPTTSTVTYDPPTTSTVTSDPPTAPPSSAAGWSPTSWSTSSPPAGSEVGGSSRGPEAVVGPDRRLFLPVSSLLLNGSGSTDNHGVSSYRWEVVSGPPGLKLEDADQAVATATGFRTGRYTFRLTVSDQEGATDSTSLTVRIQEPRTLPPVAHASGSHSLTLPNNSLVLRGSVTDGDQNQLHFLWTRDSQSPAAGEVLYGSETQASLYLSDLVEGTYLFQLRVTDAQGRSSTATATVEVRPEPGGGEQVELEMLVSVSQVSVAQRDTVVRQLAALIHVLDSDIQVRALQGHSHLSTVLRFSVRGPSGLIPGSRLVGLLRTQLLRGKSDYLLFRVLRVDTVLCLLRCSGRGQCDPITKQCTCDPFWTENLIRRYLGDGESNCEWRVLYVILTSFILMVLILSISWTFICCCRRKRQSKGRKKTKYTILDNMDEQERVELRPKFSLKHRSTEHNSSLMMSESELDSDQDAVFSRERPVRSRNRLNAQAARNGNAFG